MRFGCAAAALALAGCTALVGGGAYTYDVDPCEPVDESLCGEGATRYFVVASVALAESRDGTLEGFDLDGTDATVCAREDAFGPGGRAGIDNAISPLLAGLEIVRGGDFGGDVREAILRGESLSVVEVGGIDADGDDPCVEVRFRSGRVPEGVAAPEAYLDADGDGALDRDLTLDFGAVEQRDPRACVIDGVLHTRVDGRAVAPLPVSGVPTERFRFRAEVGEVGLSRGVGGGSFRVEDVIAELDRGGLGGPSITPIVQAAADLDFDGERCRSLSYAFSFSTVPFDPGALRP